jgi:hypothetical protein
MAEDTSAAVSGLFAFVVNCLVLAAMQVFLSEYEDNYPRSFLC